MKSIKEITLVAKERLMAKNFYYFCDNAGLMLDGYPFSFKNHEYLIEPYKVLSDPSITEVNFRKAAQMGGTVAEVLFCFHGMKNGRFPKGVLYLFPTEKHMEKASKSKIQPIIDENPLLQSWIENTDSSTHKRIGQSNFILHGMMTKLGLKTYSVDAIVYDELDETKEWDNIILAEERMSHSEVEWQGQSIKGGIIHRLSVPSIPGFGIDAYFSGNEEMGIESSDQRFRLFKCSHCGEWNCLEDEFPNCIVEVDPKKKKAIRVCKKCKLELSLDIAEWVAKKPGQYSIGFNFSQLFSHFVNPWELLNRYNKKIKLTILYNDKLSIPYIESDARLYTQEVISLCGDHQISNIFPGPAAIGIDQPKEEGGKFHVVAGFKKNDNLNKIIFIGIRNTWAELGDLMRNLNISRCVVDGLPDQAKAREFANAFPGKVYLVYYAEKQKGSYRWNDIENTLSVDRTESLDASTKWIHERKVILPRINSDIEVFAKQCQNIARRVQEDEESGSVRHIWVKTGPDHYRHAWNYCLIALGEIGEYEEIDYIRENLRKFKNEYDPLTYGLGVA